MKKPRRPRVDVNLPELNQLIDTSGERPLEGPERDKLRTAVNAMAQRLMPAFRSTEKTAGVVPTSDSGEGKPEEGGGQKEGKKPKPGHGRNGASDYTGATKVGVKNPALARGSACIECLKGKVYPIDPRPLIRIIGCPPIQAMLYELERLRCNLCGKVFDTPAPEGVGEEKYDETVASMIAQLKYGSGMPFNRLAGLQALFGVPMPPATQWQIVSEAAALLRPAYEELIKQAAQGDVVHNDDTTMKVLKLTRGENDKRTGTFTTGVVSTGQGQHPIALFFTGAQHAGENLTDVLKQRADGLPPLIHMSDGLSRNVPKVNEGLQVLWANCIPHGRRYFVDVADNFPDECRHVLEELGEVYGYDAKAQELSLDSEQRLRFHQQHSQPVMKALRQWMVEHLDEKKTEENSGLGKAMKYMLGHWNELTLFLRVPGAPLDNNICERALKKAILNRKNAYFFLTMNGAQVGDLFMSLIHTCGLNGVNPFDYLTELQRHASELKTDPAAWMPWNYRDTLTGQAEAPRQADG